MHKHDPSQQLHSFLTPSTTLSVSFPHTLTRFNRTCICVSFMKFSLCRLMRVSFCRLRVQSERSKNKEGDARRLQGQRFRIGFHDRSPELRATATRLDARSGRPSNDGKLNLVVFYVWAFSV